MTKLIAALAFLGELWKGIKEILKLKKDHDIDKSIESKRDVEDVLNSPTAGRPSRHTGADGVFDVTEEDN